MNISIIIGIILTEYNDTYLVQVNHDNMSGVLIIIGIVSKDNIKIHLIRIKYSVDVTYND